MTRELKLALIVGFSLVLVVTVLISDHLSQARKVKLADGPAEPIAVVTPGTPAAPSNAATAQPGPLAMSANPSPTTVPTADGAVTGTTPVVTEPLASNTTTYPAVNPANDVPVFRQGNGGGPVSDPALMNTINASGGEVRADGTFTVPPLTSVRNFSLTGPMSGAPSGMNGGNGNGVTTPPATPLGKPAVTYPEPKTLKPTPTVAVKTAPKLDLATTTYVVAQGDSAVKLARRYFGDANAWHKLVELNPGVIGAKGEMRQGAKIKVPTNDALAAKGAKMLPTDTKLANLNTGAAKPGKIAIKEPASDAAAKVTTYKVQKGDTLGLIAQKTLGSSKRIQDLIDVNHIDDEDNVVVGMVLKIPTKS